MLSCVISKTLGQMMISTPDTELRIGFRGMLVGMFPHILSDSSSEL